VRALRTETEYSVIHCVIHRACARRISPCM